MAVDLTDKKIAMATEAVQLAKIVMDGLARLSSLRDSLSAAGITFATADFDGLEGLEHMDGDDFTAFLGQFDYTDDEKLVGWMAQVGSPTPRVIFAKVIPQ